MVVKLNAMTKLDRLFHRNSKLVEIQILMQNGCISERKEIHSKINFENVIIVSCTVFFEN